MHIPHWLPAGAKSRMELAVGAGALAAIGIGLGIRSLSGDYLVRVAAIAHGRGSKSKGKARRKLWFFGGPTVRAGYDYVSHMMMRDWQFRRQLLPLIPMLGMLVGAAYRGMRASPFSGAFTMMHVLPHLFGFAFFIVCTVIVFGSDHKGSWLFLLAPAGAFHGFARGVYARLLSVLIAAHAILLPVLSWYRGIRDAGLFIAYSAALASVYLGLELRLIDGMPFSKQPERTQNPVVLPTLMLGGLVIALVVAIQRYFIFRSVIAVVCITPALCGVAWLVTRQSLEAFEISIRFHLGLLSNPKNGS
jgi:hypothetical protein